MNIEVKTVKLTKSKIQQMEHQYQVPTTAELFSKDFKEEYREPMFGNGFEYHKGIYVSNIKGWKQYRKIIEEQNKQDNETRN